MDKSTGLRNISALPCTSSANCGSCTLEYAPVSRSVKKPKLANASVFKKSSKSVSTKSRPNLRSSACKSASVLGLRVVCVLFVVGICVIFFG